jgi:hypothetical protein
MSAICAADAQDFSCEVLSQLTLNLWQLKSQPTLLCRACERGQDLCTARRRAKTRAGRTERAGGVGCAAGYATFREKSKWPMAGASSAEALIQIAITNNAVIESPQYPVGELQLTGINGGRFIFG